ncbi:E3 ubiquitin-protein ligase Praja-2 isoform X1 [Alosa sapidissima]|uniref:E3 ubiquitin-protein ligase Praja-2 isoform X1 n=2 Tax=Alosa sapidissima TaxID=34773 RepID=UPI001C0A0B33|nr:E3 ubiquitin-protein ligase Praja-2 isoform X1 [Alosa sapidissima]
MGQEAGKSAWPKPAGGYQTITGRRYGRRHAYVTFRPTSKCRVSSTEDRQEMEMNSVEGERSITTKGNISSMLHAIFPVNTVHPELPSKSSKEAAPTRKQSSGRGGMEVSSGIHRKKLRSDHAVAPEPMPRERGAEASAWPLMGDADEKVDERNTVSPNPSTLSFVNIDSYEPDSSDAEEDDGDEDRELDDSGADSDPSAGLQRRLDSMINDLGKDFDYLNGLHSYLRNRLGASGGGEADVAPSSSQDACGGSRDSAKVAPEELLTTAHGRTRRDSNCETVCASSADADMDRCGAGTLDASGLEVMGSFKDVENAMDAQGSSAATGAAAATSAEMVVRPKIRKQTSETHLEKKRPSSTTSSSAQAEEVLPFCGSGGAAGRSTGKVKCGSAPPFFLTQTERPGAAFLFDLPKPERCRGGNSVAPTTSRSQENGASRKSQTSRADDDEEEDDFWEDLEEFSEKCASARKGDDSSECSEGEWSASWASDSGVEPERRSSEESWETLPWLDELPTGEQEPGAQTSTQAPTTDQDQAPLEEGEIPWLLDNEETGSSSDEEPDGLSHFVHPGLFILDGNNNLEDDSSVSEDLDTEWRLLNDFGEGFGMAQAMSYVDPQLLTYMALEERLAQAMEAALAHLESLAIEVEQAHPPATEQIIECLPQITVEDDHSGQEQCCAICCCEYVNGEIATQLPCHHMFHKLCVTLWLRKSGTCPVCRHVLTPAQAEHPVHTSFTSEQDGPPSNHSAGGTR